MPLHLDPAFQAVFAAQAEASAGAVIPTEGDAAGLRAMVDGGLANAFSRFADAPSVTTSLRSTTTDDDHELPLRWYEPSGGGPGSAVLYLHGGGMVGGSAELYEPLVRLYVEWSGVPFLSVDFRPAPQPGGRALAQDGFAGLEWLHENAGRLGVDPARIAVMGDSSGGGVAAGVAILARDRGVDLARQILVYPMLDDRNTEPDPHLAGLPTAWPHLFNRIGWAAVRGESPGSELSAVHAPARLGDLSGLPPAYVEVGELDIFRDEDVEHAHRLWAAGVPCELHVHPGAPHGHDLMLLGSPAGERWRQDKIRVITSI